MRVELDAIADEILSLSGLTRISLAHARTVIEAWRVEYNAERPHSALGNRTHRSLPPAGKQPRRTRILNRGLYILFVPNPVSGRPFPDVTRRGHDGLLENEADDLMGTEYGARDRDGSMIADG